MPLLEFKSQEAERLGKEHAELQAKTDSILNDVKNLQARRASLPSDSPEIATIDKALAEHQQAFTDLYHPTKQPNAFQKLGRFLEKHVARKEPAPLPKSNAVTPERMAGLEASAAGTQSDPYLTPEELKKKARIAAGIEPRAADKPLMKPYRVNGVIAYYDANHPETIPQGASAVVAGGTPKPLKFDAATDEVIDQNTGERYKRDDPDAPPEVKDVFAGAKRATDTKQKNTVALAYARGAAYGQFRPLAVLDSQNGNAPTYVTMRDAQAQPGRYLPAGPGQTALAQENLMQDIAGTSQQAREAVNNLKADFPLEMRTKLAVAMRDNDPGGALGQLISSGALGSLTSDQQDFLIAINQLTENAMAMRSVLKTGQGAEDIRSAIRNTLPGVLSPDKSFALRQLDAFDKTLARLHRGVPRVKLPATAGEAKDRINISASSDGNVIVVSPEDMK